jgi:hypothetical protein
MKILKKKIKAKMSKNKNNKSSYRQQRGSVRTKINKKAGFV